MWLVLLTTLVAKSLPEIPINEKWKQCQDRSECIVAGDACRSCGMIVVINKKYREDFMKLDQNLRQKSGTIRTCEACSTNHLPLSCFNGQCGLKSKSLGN